MREGWVATIVRLSGYIYRIKQRLLVLHAMQGFFCILYIFFLEILLLFISIPAYVFIYPTALPRSGQAHYRVRRIITISLLLPLTLLWLLQVGFVVIGSYYFDPRNALQIIPGVSSEQTVEYIPPKSEIASLSSQISPPHISHLDTSKANSFMVSGTGEKGLVVVLTAEQVGGTSSFSKMYTTPVNTDGTWDITHDQKISLLPAGTYQLSAITYDQTHQIKSASTSQLTFVVHNSVGDWLLHSGVALVNISLIILIILAIVLTLLTM